MRQTSEVYKLLQQLKIIHKVAHLCREAGITFLVGSRSRLTKIPNRAPIENPSTDYGGGDSKLGISAATKGTVSPEYLLNLLV